MVVAIDSEGRLFSSYHQCNSDRYTFMLMIYELVTILDEEDANWRDNTIFMADNASFHHVREVKELFRKLRVGILFSSPHSPAVIPVEMVSRIL